MSRQLSVPASPTKKLETTMKNYPIHGFALAAIAAAALAACGGDGESQPFNVKPTFVGTVSAKTYDGNSDDLLTARPRQDRPGGGDCAGLRQSGRADRRRTAPRRDLQQLPRDRRHDGRRRLRHAVRAERRCIGHCDSARRQGRRHRIHHLRRRWQRQAERHADGAGAGDFQSGQPVHHHRDIVRIARRLRRDLDR